MALIHFTVFHLPSSLRVSSNKVKHSRRGDARNLYPSIVVGGKSLNKSSVPQLADAGFKAVPIAPIIWEGQIGNLSTGATTDGKEITDISISVPAAP